MDRTQMKQGGGRTPNPYAAPEMTQIGISVERGFAGSAFEEDPTIGGETPLDPYGPDNFQSY